MYDSLLSVCLTVALKEVQHAVYLPALDRIVTCVRKTVNHRLVVSIAVWFAPFHIFTHWEPLDGFEQDQVLDC